jgi:hypothetical protein
MYGEIKGGTKYVIMDAFNVPMDCWVPPVGYGIDSITGKLEKTDIIKRSTKTKDQYWEREDLPDWYDKKRELEEIKQQTVPDYTDPDCEKIRESHWRRRLRGCWFYNDGVPTYITGLHWLVVNWWKFQGKYFDFRIPNMEFFYFLQYCIEDPHCLGTIEITKRKEGKTARAGAFIYEYISRTSAKHGGIQSKTDPDAKEVFLKAVRDPWRKLPHFFKPKYDTSKGTAPDTELRFFNPSKRGRPKLISEKEEEALESFINFESRKEGAYDGPELHRYVSDEAGKLKDVSILKRHSVVQFCSEVDGEYVGVQLYTTTVEEMESGGSEFLQLVKMSDRRKLDANGRTASGLYPYFLAAFRTLYYNIYGKPDEEKAKIYYMNTRASLQSRPRELSSFIRKNPFTLSEAFRVDGEKCLYDSEKLNNRRDWLSWHDNITEQGNFAWIEPGNIAKGVRWEASKNGRFEIAYTLKESEANRILVSGDQFAPNNNHAFTMGCDPYKFKDSEDSRRSDCAAFVYQKFNIQEELKEYNDAFVCKYKYRASSTGMQYDDILKMCVYYGCQVLFEINIGTAPLDYFGTKKCGAFCMKLPGEKEAGIYTDGQGQVLSQLCDLTESWIDSSCDKLLFIDLCDDWLEFNPAKTTKFDCAMAAGFALIACKKKYKIKDESLNNEVTNFFRQHVAS